MSASGVIGSRFVSDVCYRCRLKLFGSLNGRKADRIGLQSFIDSIDMWL